MGRLVVLGTTALVLTTLAAAGSRNAGAARLVGHADFVITANQVHSGPFPGAQVSAVTVVVDAYDKYPNPSTNPTAPTGDWGTVTITYPDGDRNVYTVTNTDIGAGGGGVTIWAGGSILLFRDGGTPGNEIVGPPGPGGVAPTRDWYQLGRIGTGAIHKNVGYVTSGEIQVTSPYHVFEVP